MKFLSIFLLEILVSMTLYSQNQNQGDTNVAMGYWVPVLEKNLSKKDLNNIGSDYIYCFNLGNNGEIILDTTNLFIYDAGRMDICHLFRLKQGLGDYELILTREGNFNFRVFELIISALNLSDTISLVKLKEGNENILFNKSVIASFKSGQNNQYLVEFLCKNSGSNKPGASSLSPLKYYKDNRSQLLLKNIKDAVGKINNCK